MENTMASDRTRELARKYLIRRDSRFERESYMPDAFDELVYVLDALERETRVDELWIVDHHIAIHGFEKLGPWLESRKKSLAAQPTPEVKK